jgi:hypothetical protein
VTTEFRLSLEWHNPKYLLCEQLADQGFEVSPNQVKQEQADIDAVARCVTRGLMSHHNEKIARRKILAGLRGRVLRGSIS